MPEKTTGSWRGLAAAGVSFAIMTLGLTLLLQSVGLERLQAAIVEAGALAPILYILVRAATFIAAPLSSGPIQFASGALFGLIPGTFYSLVGEVLGGTANFWIARLLGRPVVTRLVGKSGMQRIEGLYGRVGEAWTLVYARLFFFAFYDFVSYAAGMTPVRYRTYALITAIVGIIPTFIAVAVGTTLTGQNNEMVLLYAALGVLCVVPLVFYNRVRRWFKRDRATEVHGANTSASG
jgi:uncharacterized membrane protein YdjX (TVP38/TMEM64 family)